MILHCNYEEIQALRSGAQSVLDPLPGHRSLFPVPTGERLGVEALVPQLEGDLYFQTLAELRSATAAVHTIVRYLRVEMDALVIDTHPADEGAVAAYFDFAHALAVLGRLEEMNREMEAVIELATGSPASTDATFEFVFPD